MVSLLVVCLVAVLPAISVAPSPDNGLEGLEYLGCYEDEGWHNRAFRETFHNVRSNIDWSRWKDLSYIVRLCAQKLNTLCKDNPVFSVQNWGECRSDNVENRFKDFKKSSKCYSHVGSPMNNAVYRIKSKCNVNDPLYFNGSSHYSSCADPSKCHSCKCIKGETKCSTITCDYSVPCEKYLPPSKGACCRKCACHHLGKNKMNGEEWDDRTVKGTCRECRCINGEADCGNKLTCQVDCPDPEYIPGRCCPRCKPKAPVTPKWEVITIPTKRPEATFPPGFGWPFGKRSLSKLRMKTEEHEN